MNKKVLVLVAVIFALSGALYGFYNFGNISNSPVTPAAPSVTIVPSESSPSSTNSVDPTPTSTPSLVVYDKKSPNGYDHFFELVQKVEGQYGYVAYPKQISASEPPKHVVYYHGSGQKISSDFSDQVMKNMRKYGAYFTSKGYVFLASNQHGDNWGQAVAVSDTVSLQKWVKKSYPLSSSYAVIGFSMGGMGALRHGILHQDSVTHIALLAPANQIELYTTAQKKILAKLPIRIWHGTKDVNVPYSASTSLVSGLKSYSPTIRIITLTGKTHWDVDTEYMKDIYEWISKE